MVGIVMKPTKITIQALILTLTTFAMLGTFLGSIFSSVIVSKENLENSYLNENQFYAQKLAYSTNSLFKNMLQTLRINSEAITKQTSDDKALYSELRQILESTNFFNSVIFVDRNSTILGTAPRLGLDGKKIESIGAKEAIKRKTPIISQPYLGVTGRLIILVSIPVYNELGSYLGFLGGSIYLDEENSLKDTLGQHPKHLNNSYVYVVDSKGNIIYHPESRRINDNVIENRVVKKVIQGQEGSLEVVNTKGKSMLAGYAFVDTSNWGIVSQTPKVSVTKPTYKLAIEVALFTTPFMIFVFLISLLLLKKIVNPLRRLADYAHIITERQTVPIPDIPERFFELKELKKAIFILVDFYQRQVQLFESESHLDPLTGLYNRRFFNKRINDYHAYSLILFDIDHFKLVNDEYGHMMGDEVLKFLAELIKLKTREGDLCFRFGGEEFLILLPDTDINTTYTIAERIRKSTETTISPIGKAITISIGIGNMPNTSVHHTELFNLIDQALYKAKNEGRNRIVNADD
jgi:diguanylate cyclase (GGDEF)-like protein